MLASSHKQSARRWACYALAFTLGSLAALAICPPADAQVPAAPAPTDQPPATPAPATQPPAVPATTAGPPATPAATTAAPAPAPAAPAKPRGMILDPTKYTQLKVPSAVEEAKYKKDRTVVQRILRTGVIPANQEAFVRKYYYSYALARWTFLSHQSKVATYQRELKNELTMSYKSGRGTNQAHDQLIQLVLSFMKNVVRKDLSFSPAARYNAILMIGELNEVENNRRPVPLPAALDELYLAANDPDQLDAVRLGALIGLRRHCRLEVADSRKRDAILRFLGKLAVTKESAKVRSDEGHAWFRLLAVLTLADLKGEPQPAAVANIFCSIVNEKDAPAFLRYTAASSLVGIDYTNAAGADFNGLVHALGVMAIELCDEERQKLRDETQSEKTPGSSMGYGSGYTSPEGGDEVGGYADAMGGYGEGEYGGGYGGTTTVKSTKEERQVERARRRLKQGMSAVLIGLGRKTKRQSNTQDPEGLYSLAAAEVQRQNIELLSNAMHEFLVTIDTKEDDKQIDAKPLDEAIEELRATLATAITQVGAAVAEAPELEPLAEPRAAGYGGYEDGYEEMGGGYPGEF